MCFNIEFHLEPRVDEIINEEVMEGHQYHTCYSRFLNMFQTLHECISIFQIHKYIFCVEQ
jgi:hypothetical protein